MWTCPNCHEKVEDSFENCWNCGTSRLGELDPDFKPETDSADESETEAANVESGQVLPPADMLIVTSPTLVGHHLEAYKGMVFGEAIVRANFMDELSKAFTDGFSGRSRVYEDVLSRARNVAMDKMAAHARHLGANAIVSVQVDHQFAQTGTMMVSMTGTAVQVVPKDPTPNLNPVLPDY